MEYLGNGFSWQMVEEDAFPCDVYAKEVSKEEALDPKNKSIIGHQDTAAVLGVKYNRETIKLHDGDVLYLAQLQGGRLPEGAKTLPEGFSFMYLKLTVESFNTGDEVWTTPMDCL